MFFFFSDQNEDDFDKFLNSKSLKPDEVRIVVKKSYEEFSTCNFHSKFVNRLKNGLIKVLWINNDKSVGEPYFLESAALHKHLQKKNGLCSNMIGLQPYKNQNLTTSVCNSELKKDDIPSPLPEKETEKPREFLASTTIPNLPIIVSTNNEVTISQTQTGVNNSVCEIMPKITSAFSIPLLNSENNTTDNNKTLPELLKSNGVHRPMIKCKPTSALMAHAVQPSLPTLKLLPNANNNDLINVTSPSNSGRNISYINNSFNLPQIENGNNTRIDFEKSIPSTGIYNVVPQEYANNNVISGLDINVTNNQNIMPTVSNYTSANNLISTQIRPVSTAPSVPFTAGYPYRQPVIVQPAQPSIPLPVINYQLRDALNQQVAEVPSTTKRVVTPFYDLQSVLQERGVKLWCAFCWKNLIVSRILVKFKIVISEMYKNNVVSNTFHVKFNLLSGEEFSIGVTNSYEKDQNICQWSNKYQSQLIRAFKKDEILKTISETVHYNDEDVRKKVEIFLNVLLNVYLKD